MRTFHLLILAAAALLLGSRPLLAQTKAAPAACALISSAQLNKLLGARLADGTSNAGGKYCAYRSPDNKQEVTLNMMPNGAGISAMFLKSGFETASKDIKTTGKHLENYTEIHAFAAGGPNAYWLAGKSKLNGGEVVVRCQFVLKETIVSIDARGLPKDQVSAKLADIYQQLKTRL